MTENFYPIIAFTGFFGVGKSEAVGAIPDTYTWVSFAEPLKNMLAAIGLSYEQLYGSEKHVPTPLLCNLTPRFAMEMLGTGWARELMHEDFWTNLWKETVYLHPEGVVCDDCRFPNEFKTIKELGGILIRIERPGHKASHLPTDQAQLALVPDRTIINDGTIEDLHRKVRDAARTYD